ncbi:sugar phosphate isomerase/epimerase family protein [Sporosarcina highlanderae]|uniref:Sugar phosphate isomerase/epimerase n=1 Tax=Sporosarcina highlanderae TaxID=3035916 RepID=A0ABT8JVG6_9BACL|nr:sugar phosphate isomerase/epimerase family protein [Sporosarcina highlanderae]MDN4609173.1 sugar phosphate isomerase/epimerase [Sporosarcina highlanderae]
MKLGINTYPFLWTATIEEAFEEINQIGFKQVEILTSPPFFPLHSDEIMKADKINSLKKNFNINIHSLNLPGQDINLASPFKEMREFSENQYKKLINLAKNTDIPYIVMPPGRLHPLLPPDFEWIWGITKPHIESLVEYAAQNNVTMLIENIPSLFLQSSEQIKYVIEEINSENLGVIYDVANGFMVENPVEGIKMLNDKIKLVHLSDTTQTKWAHDVIGTGDVDFESVYTALEVIHYKGVCILEIIHPQAKEGLLKSIDNLISQNWKIEY